MKNGTLFKIIYSIFVVTAILYNKTTWGIFTLRQIMAIILFVACVISEKKLFCDKYFGTYCIYILFFVISSAATGYTLIALERCVGLFFVAYVGYWGTKILSSLHNGTNFFIFVIISPLSLVGALIPDFSPLIK